MDTTATRELEALETEYLKRTAEIRADGSLSYEKKELRIKALGDEYNARRRKLEEA
jgi:hypothetical protein